MKLPLPLFEPDDEQYKTRKVLSCAKIIFYLFSIL